MHWISRHSLAVLGEFERGREEDQCLKVDDRKLRHVRVSNIPGKRRIRIEIYLANKRRIRIVIYLARDGLE